MGPGSTLVESTPGRRRSPGRATAPVSVSRYDGPRRVPAEDVLAVEEPLEMQLAWGPAEARETKSISVTMRTPGNDFELAAGFLMTEGIVQDSGDIAGIDYVSGRRAAEVDGAGGRAPAPGFEPERNVVRVELSPGVTVSLAHLERNFYTTSSCGICGKASLLALRTVCPPRSPSRLHIDAETLYALPQRLRAAQSVFAVTGGIHAAGLFDAGGRLLASREDVGRHNAVDKLLGAEFLADRTPLRDRLLLLSGRASFELLQKSLMAGIPMVASVGAPSSLAVQVAREFEITLVGFLHEGRCNVYHGESRILGGWSAVEG